MCHWIREPDGRRNIVGEQWPAKPDAIRPRLVGAVAATVIALVATAALLLSPSTPAVSREQAATAAAVSTPRVTQPSGPVIEQTAGGLDDDVPTSPVSHDSARGGHHCDHGV